MSDRRYDYSLVVPVYCNAGSLEPLVRSLAAEVLPAHPQLVGEILFVDDGSQDDSFAELQRIRRAAPCDVTVIQLTRNFGQIGAILAGYHHARGDCVVTISADGQEPPELVNQLLRGFFDEHYDLVIGVRAGRDESWYRSLTSRLYFSLLRRVSVGPMPATGFDSWLLSRRALEVFLRNVDTNPSFHWRLLWLGYRTKRVAYRRRARLTGRSRFSLSKKLGAALDGLLGYSPLPIRALALVGGGLATVGIGGGILALVERLRGLAVPAWLWPTTLVLLIGGLQMAMIGLVGEYVWRTLAQVRHNDPYLIDRIYRPEDS